jgi:hypothetical protein
MIWFQHFCLCNLSWLCVIIFFSSHRSSSSASDCPLLSFLQIGYTNLGCTCFVSVLATLMSVLYLVRYKYLRRWCVEKKWYTTVSLNMLAHFDAWLVIRNKYLLVLADSKSFPSQGNDRWDWFKEDHLIMEKRNLETTGQTVIRCSLHLFSSAADYWSTGGLTLDITTDIYVVFSCKKIKSHTGLHPTVKSSTHSNEQWKTYKNLPSHLLFPMLWFLMIYLVLLDYYCTVHLYH